MTGSISPLHALCVCVCNFVCACVCVFYLLMYLLCGLSITERHCSQVFQDGHLHGAVASIQQRHQGARMHWPVHYLGPNTCRETEREERELIIYVWHTQSSELEKKQQNVGNALSSRKCLHGLGLCAVDVLVLLLLHTLVLCV